MAKPSAITYQDVLKNHGGDLSAAKEAWRNIGVASGAGHVPDGELAAIDLTGAADDVKAEVKKLASPAKEEKKAGGN